MKDEKVWNYSICNIGYPCINCIKECTFRRDSGVDKKENNNESTTEELKGRNELYSN